jgi:hypothetical protein
LAAGETHHRLDEVPASSWILPDQEDFRADPRQPMAVR